ncbi:MAG: cytochrome c3 family protein [Chloroflexota bacterium]|nr:cytochrome c3 family protein [Chloroflexota bacterium]
MKRVTVGLIAVLALLLVVSGVAFADNDLHDASMLTEADACAGCHRAHTGEAAKLLKAGPGQDDFCFSCHDGSAAETNVVDGVLAGSSYGTDGAGLRGGGFTYALMDLNRDGTTESGNVTSIHTSDGETDGTMWGSGPVNASEDYGVTVALACGDCHNPHGNGNYRILRGLPNGMEGETPGNEVEVPDVDPKVYEITYTAAKNRDVSYAPSLLDEWCAQCHTRYNAPGNAGHIDSGDMVFAYRHAIATIGGKCLACHVAHGTSATMGTYSSAVQYPDSSGDEGSALLWLNNRAVCLTGCHEGSDLSAD